MSQFNESSAVSTTYLGKTDKTRKNVIRVKGQFSVMDTLLDGTENKTLLDSGATKRFM